MRQAIVLLIAFQWIIFNHANAQVTETYTETKTETKKDGKFRTVRTETITEAGGTHTRTYTETGPVEVSFGLKTNANMSRFLLQKMAGYKCEMKPGVSLGGFMKIESSRGFVLQPELIVHYKTLTMKEKSSGMESDYQYWGIEIPIYYIGQFKLGSGKGFAGAAPYVALGLDARSETAGESAVNLYEKDEITDKATMQRWDFGFNALLGYEFKFGLQINAGYQIGLINTLKSPENNAKIRNQGLSLGVGYKF